MYDFHSKVDKLYIFMIFGFYRSVLCLLLSWRCKNESFQLEKNILHLLFFFLQSVLETYEEEQRCVGLSADLQKKKKWKIEVFDILGNKSGFALERL